MPDPTTTNIKLFQPANGADSGTWDQPMNANAGIIDSCFGNVTTVSGLASSPVTLNAAQSQVNIIRLSGTLTGFVTLTVAAIKSWVIDNQTIGNLNFCVLLSGGSGNTCGIQPGVSQMYWDGTSCGWIGLGFLGEEVYTFDDAPAWINHSTVPPYLLANGATFNISRYPLLYDLLDNTNTLPDLNTGHTGVVYIRAS